MLALTEQNIIGEGNSRIVYQHPSRSDLVIKIEKNNTTNNKPNNKIDFIYYKHLIKNKKDTSSIAKCHGWVKTNMGEGLLFEKIVNEDHTDVLTLQKALENKLVSVEAAKKLLDGLLTYLEYNNIILGDISLDNIVYQKIDTNDFKLIIIDGLGGRRLKFNFWLYLTFDCLAKRKVKKQIKKLERYFLEFTNTFH